MTFVVAEKQFVDIGLFERQQKETKKLLATIKRNQI
jgi:hypothetical protein